MGHFSRVLNSADPASPPRTNPPPVDNYAWRIARSTFFSGGGKIEFKATSYRNLESFPAPDRAALRTVRGLSLRDAAEQAVSLPRIPRN